MFKFRVTILDGRDYAILPKTVFHDVEFPNKEAAQRGGELMVRTLCLYGAEVRVVCTSKEEKK